MNSKVPPTTQALQEINKQYVQVGLSNLIVYCFPSGDSARQNQIEPQPSTDLALETRSCPSKGFHYDQLSPAEVTDLITALGCIGIGTAIAIHQTKWSRATVSAEREL